MTADHLFRTRRRQRFLARIIAPALKSALGQSVVIENRPSRLVGAVGAVANPDGYTLIIGGGSFLNASLVEKTPYDPIKDFTGVSQLERSPNVLVVHPSLPVNSVKDLIAVAKAQPGKLNYSSGASGSSSHIGAEMLKMSTGINYCADFIPQHRAGAHWGGSERNAVDV